MKQVESNARVSSFLFWRTKIIFRLNLKKIKIFVYFFVILSISLVLFDQISLFFIKI